VFLHNENTSKLNLSYSDRPKPTAIQCCT